MELLLKVLLDSAKIIDGEEVRQTELSEPSYSEETSKKETWNINEDCLIAAFMTFRHFKYGRLYPPHLPSRIFFLDLSKFFHFFAPRLPLEVLKLGEVNSRSVSALKRRMKEIRFLNKGCNRTYFTKLISHFGTSFTGTAFIGKDIFKDKAYELSDKEYLEAFKRNLEIVTPTYDKRGVNAWSLEEDRILFHTICVVFMRDGTLFPTRGNTCDWAILLNLTVLAQANGNIRTTYAVKRRFKTLKSEVAKGIKPTLEYLLPF